MCDYISFLCNKTRAAMLAGPRARISWFFYTRIIQYYLIWPRDIDQLLNLHASCILISIVELSTSFRQYYLVYLALHTLPRIETPMTKPNEIWRNDDDRNNVRLTLMPTSCCLLFPSSVFFTDTYFHLSSHENHPPVWSKEMSHFALQLAGKWIAMWQTWGPGWPGHWCRVQDQVMQGRTWLAQLLITHFSWRHINQQALKTNG